MAQAAEPVAAARSAADPLPPAFSLGAPAIFFGGAGFSLGAPAIFFGGAGFSLGAPVN